MSVSFSPERWVLIAQMLASGWMFGLIWFVQVVHYPLFGAVTGDRAVPYANGHQRRTTLVVGPPMLIEMLAAGWIVLNPPAHVPVWLALTGLGMIAALWLSTAFLQVPCHARIAQSGHDTRVIARLVRTNWVRTALWTARALLAAWMLAAA